MKRPQYVFRPNLNEPQHRRAWALLQQVPPAKRKEFLVQSILAAEQTDRLEKSIRKNVLLDLFYMFSQMAMWQYVLIWFLLRMVKIDIMQRTLFWGIFLVMKNWTYPPR